MALNIYIYGGESALKNADKAFVTSKPLTVYRSVSLEEYQDIIANGFKPGANSFETGKLFVDNLSDARFYNSAFGNSIIVQARIPSGVAIEQMFGVDGLKYIYNVPLNSIDKLKFIIKF